jgi:hypothetical protein
MHSEINERLNRKLRSSVSSDNLYGKYRYSPVLLFFLVYLIASLGPISADDIVELTNNIIELKGKKNKSTIDFMLSLGIALGLFKKNIRNNKVYYSCVDFDKLFNHESTKKILTKILKVAQERSQI